MKPRRMAERQSRQHPAGTDRNADRGGRASSPVSSGWTPTTPPAACRARPVRRRGLSRKPRAASPTGRRQAGRRPAGAGSRRLEMGGGQPRPRLERDPGCGRIYPQPVDVPQELLDLKTQAEAELEDIHQSLEDTESDALTRRAGRGGSEARRDRGKLESFVAYDPEEMRSAGCYVSIGHDGELSVERGLVRREDMKRLADDGDARTPKPKGMPDSLQPRSRILPVAGGPGWRSPGTGWSPSTCWPSPPPAPC